MDENNLHNPSVAHERGDINIWVVGKFGIALALITVASLFLVWWLFDRFIRREAAQQAPPPSALVNVDARKLPPEPRLQQTPVIDLKQMRAAEDAILNGYAWVDPEKGIVRIPVERALEIVAQKGLPARAAQPAAPMTTLSESGLITPAQQKSSPVPPPQSTGLPQGQRK